MADNNSEYKDLFVEEAREHLNTLNQFLLALEKNPHDKDALNKIFRAAHTIKGMSATMNYEKIQKLSHKTEDALDLIRNNKLQVDAEIMDLIFKCFDGIETMVEQIAQNNMTEFDIGGIIEDLEKHMSIEDAAKKKEAKAEKQITINEIKKLSLTTEAQQDIIKEINNGKRVYKLTISVDKSCTMKSIRAFLLLKKLSDSGDIPYSVPEKKSIEDGAFDEGFVIYYVSNQDQQSIEKIVNSVSELSTRIVSPILYENNQLNVQCNEQPEKPALSPEQKQAPSLEKSASAKQAENKTKVVTSDVQSIRIGMDQLDLFMNLIGELVISKSRLSQIASVHNLEDLSETASTVDRLTTELQDKIMMIRMIPMKHIFDRFPRMIRDLARDNGKKINLVIKGEGIELDRTILDEIGDPLVHLLRNAIDHGIETPEVRKANGKPEDGTVYLIAERTRNHVLITVRDDGKGINPLVMRNAAVRKGLKTQEEVDKLDDKEAINLLFLAGLSTSEKITNVSGRGVGMDVVKSTIEKLNGSVEIFSEIGKGSTFNLRLPLTMAIVKALFIEAGEEIYAIPISNIVETIRLEKKDIQMVGGRKTTILRSDVLPLAFLRDILNIDEKEEHKTTMNAVVIQKEDSKIGLIVDRLIGEQEITIKNIGGTLKRTKGVAGVTITGDGRVVLVIDVNTLV